MRFFGRSIAVAGGDEWFRSGVVRAALCRWPDSLVTVVAPGHAGAAETGAPPLPADPRVRVVTADVSDRSALALAASGADTVVVAAGGGAGLRGRRHPTASPDLLDIVSAAREAGAARAVAVLLPAASALVHGNSGGHAALVHGNSGGHALPPPAAPTTMVHTNTPGPAGDTGRRTLVHGNGPGLGPCAVSTGTKVHGNRAGDGSGGDVRLAVVRCGHVLGSRGSLVPLFRSLRGTGEVPLPDLDMTRFVTTSDRYVGLVLDAAEACVGGETYVVKCPSVRVADVARAVAPAARLRVLGLRDGEPLHECLISPEEATRAFDFGDYFIIMPDPSPGPGRVTDVGERTGAVSRPVRCREGYVYSSHTNVDWLTAEDVRVWLGGAPSRERGATARDAVRELAVES